MSAAVPAAAAQSVVTVAYDARNIPTLVSGSYGVLAQNEQHDTNGHLTKRSYGDLANTTAAYSYDAKHRLTSASVTRAAAPPLWSTSVPGYSAPSGPLGSSLTTPLTLESLAFRYDAVSNPVAIFDSRSPSEWPDNAGPLSATLGYDDLYRLTSTAYAPAPFSSDVQSPPFYSTDPPPIAFVTPATRVKSQTFGYDATGNVTSSSDDQNALLQRSAGSATYGAPNSGGVTGPNQIAQGESPGGAYVTTYDASGNLTSLAATRRGICSRPGARSPRLPRYAARTPRCPRSPTSISMTGTGAERGIRPTTLGRPSTPSTCSPPFAWVARTGTTTCTRTTTSHTRRSRST